MGSIGNAFSSLFPNLIQTVSPGQQPPQLSFTAPPANTYGEAFEMELSQQVNPDGTDSDEVVCYTSGRLANGDGCATISMSTGDSAESAYESMIAGMNSFGAIDGSQGPGTATGDDPMTALTGIFDSMENTLGNSSGTVTVGMGAFLPQSTPGISGSTGTDSTPTFCQFVDSVITSLQSDLDNMATNATTTADITAPTTTSGTSA